MRLAIKTGLLMLAGVTLVACVSRQEVEELKKNQEKILAKLDDVGKAAPTPSQAQQRPRGPDPQKVYAFPVGESHIKGPKDAWVTIVEVSDFECPFCNRVNPTLKQIKDKYGDDVRLVFKHNPLPFHKRAEPAAMAAECAGEQGKFWEMHDKLFENQRALGDDQLNQYAKDIGVDTGRFTKCMESGKYKGKIQEHQRTAQQLGARGTPAFFINGRFLSGAQPFPSFQAIIDEELKKAKDSGVSKSEYYAKQVEQKGAKSM